LSALVLAGIFLLQVGVAQGQTFLAVDGAVFETCSGTFYDSGGAGGNYANGQDITTTICPTGGVGAGPLTSVQFLTWAVAGGPPPGDQLVIHDGTTTSDPVIATGSSSNSLAGLTVTASGSSGCLTFRWTSDAGGVAAGWSAAILTGPDAGTDASATYCANDGAVQLFTLLGGDPDAGGTWTAPGGGAHSGTFDPSSDPAGVYEYTVTGSSPCPDPTATVTIAIVEPPDPGSNGALTLCSDGPSTALFGSLGGSPDPGGTWVGPGGAHDGTFDPATDPPGDYTYRLAASPPCDPVSATVTVAVNPRLLAGTNGTLAVCSNGATVDLFTRLGGVPAPGGTWTGPTGGAVSSSYVPGTSAPGIYTYTVQGLAPCAPSSATVTVTQVEAPDAGGDRSIVVCSDDAAFNLIGLLNGTPDAGGTWTGPTGPHGSTFDPASDPPGNYVYLVLGTAPCANASATLSIQVRQAPDAGVNASTTVCSTDASFALFGVLDGSPDAGGAWTAPGGASHPGTFIPGTSVPGVYTYTVTGQAPCVPATATVTVSVNAAPNAGTNATVTRCSNDASFSLFSQLGGTPNAGGTWTGPGGAHNGTFIPGTDAPGAYTYLVAGIAPCANATAVVTVIIVAAPNAGTSATTTVCSNDAPFSLLATLGGSPNAAGSWTGPGGASNGTFTPGTSQAGVYTYTVAGTSPCANAQSTVTVTVVQAPNAGTNGSVTVCSSNGPVDLFVLLGGTPTAGGTWTRPDGQPHSGTYLPGTQVGGNYTYTVQGTAPCANATAVIQVVRIIAPNAGTDGTITVCSTNAPFPLNSILGGSPSSGGTWIGPGNTSSGGTFTPGTSAPGLYTYVVAGTSPCVNDSAFVTVNVNPAPDAGENTSLTVCSSDAPFPLFDVLLGTPDIGGVWTRPNGTPGSGTFDPENSAPGGYTYTVVGLTPCLNATSVVVVSVNRQPLAGGDESFTRCSTSGPVDLFDELAGNPDAGGIWTGPSGISSGIFTPGTSIPGTYSYVVSGVAPCLNDTAQVVANVNQAPNAGSDGDITVCEGTASVDLFDGLGGSPDLTGTWVDLDGTGQLSANFFSPLGLPPGDYDFRYEVPANGPCPADIALVTVTIVAQLDAGSNGNLSACGTNTQVNLFSGLGGSPQQGGQWIDLPGTGALTNQFFNATLVTSGTYTFRYRLQGILGCDSDSAQVNVTVVAPPNAGTSGTTSTCSNASPFGLFQFLGGSPASGGQWRRGSPTGPPFSGVYNPVLDNPGTFFYIVSGTSPCVNAVSSVTVTETPAPNAGISRSITVCSNDAPFTMTDSLGGDPDPGTWGIGGQNHSPIFTPGLDIQGIYEYRVTGQFPCLPAQVTLTITVISAADAGGNGSRTVCSDQPEFLLFTVLGGTPQFGGFWLGPLGPHDGSYQPGTDEPGDYLYIVEGEGPCANDTALVSIFENDFPDAGISNSVSYCSTDPQVNLFNVLLGTPDAGGSWVGPAPTNPTFSGVFTPGTSLPGIYTYSVVGVPPCTTRTATVAVSVSQSASAGISNSIIVCSNDTPFAMADRLLGTPALNGDWRGPLPGTQIMSGIFFPGVTAPGTYRYTVAGVGQCAPVSTTLAIAVNPQPVAGNDADTTLCETSGATNLFPLLGSNAQVGGTWRRASDNAPHSGIILPGVDQSDTYIYRVNGLPPCTFDEASVTVVINASPEAGCNGLITVCNNQPPVALFALLGCTPQVPGFWLNPSGALHSGVFNPGLDQPGVYAYVVAGSAPCVNDTALVTVIQNVAPDAGDPSAVVVCSDQPNLTLFSVLAGSPQPGGEWFDPAGASFSGTYDPGNSEPGVYKYRIIAAAPCLSDSATVTVVENQAPNAGISGAAQICSSSAPVALISWLGGTPDPSGSWTLNSDPHGPFFDPAIDVSGPYLYTVAGSAPCSNATAQVQVTRVTAVSAGSDGAVAACLNADAINLFSALGGSPDTGGSWVNVGNVGVLNGSVWNATGVPPGVYLFRYNVNGQGPCPSASAEVTVTITPALNAGNDSSEDACSGQLVVLFDALGGSPQSGGFWVDVDGSGALVGGGVFNTSVVPPGTQWSFDYVLPASAQCEADTARVTVNVLEGPYAGCDGGLNLCSNSASIQLATGLNCGPDGGGSWFGPDLLPHGAVLDPATDDPGPYGYVVAAIGSCVADTAYVTVSVTPAPDAGVNGTLAICSTDNAVDMFGALGPNAQAGGSWVYVTGGNTGHSPLYNPAVDNPGVYQYTVLGQGTCSNASALVVVSEPQAPNAGCTASVAFCSSQAPVLMRPLLGCSPQAGGTWVGPGGPHGNFFDPATDTPGVYTYVLLGVTPCANDSSTLTVAVTTAANPGQSTTLQACVSQTEVDLFAALGTNVTEGGTWTDVGGSGALTGNLFDPSVAGNGTWVVTYAFAANGPCAAVSAQVTVNVGSGSSAGTDNSATVCGADCSFPLITALGGSPDAGGTWIDQLGTGALMADGMLNTCMLPAGTVAPFTYSIVDAQCGNVQATVLITVAPYPDPGGDISIVLCATDLPLNLFDQLIGEPETGGTWTDPNGTVSSGVFVPGTSVPGPYDYSLLGNATCPDTVSTVTITVNQPANAGANGELVVCDTLQALDLFQGLLGSPQTGGTWLDLDGSGAMSNGFLNTGLAGPGEFTFRYTVVVPGCGSASALVKVEINGGVTVLDVQRTCNTVDRTYTVQFTLTGGDTTTYAVTGLAGELSEGPAYVFTSVPLVTSSSFEAFVVDQFACEVVRIAGDSPCDFDEAVFVPESFSPNGDGVNDVFVIPGIEGYPGNTIVIFNRWGGKVFEAAGYNNGSVVWDGASPDALLSGNSPTGTYFYVLELGDGQEALTGYIYLNR